MLRSNATPTTIATAAVAVLALAALPACRERAGVREVPAAYVSTGDLSAACAGDSLRPSAAAPAQGLWLYDRPLSHERVAAMIGPPQSEAGTLTVSRAVETIEIDPAGDTVRAKVAAASVALELVPVSGVTTLGGGSADTTASQPAATYVLPQRVRLAAYEPCAMSSREPRVRYFRRDASGRIVTDVMLHRTSAER